jgi:cbb3-type cytochrome oxidase subunit 3
VFLIGGSLSALAGLGAWFVLRPMRRAQLERSRIDLADDLPAELARQSA